MKAYSFSMENVLEWRENIEKTSMEKFAIAQNELIQEKQLLEHLHIEHESIKQRSLSYKNINELQQSQLYKRSIEEKIQGQVQVIQAKNDELERLRHELIDAQKDRKIMEKLKEKDFHNYNESMKAEDQKNLDEIAVLKYKRT